jgi:hypothetical protein
MRERSFDAKESTHKQPLHDLIPVLIGIIVSLLVHLAHAALKLVLQLQLPQPLLVLNAQVRP